MPNSGERAYDLNHQAWGTVLYEIPLADGEGTPQHPHPARRLDGSPRIERWTGQAHLSETKVS